MIMNYKITEAKIEDQHQIIDLYRKAGWYSYADNYSEWLTSFIENSFSFAVLKNSSNEKVIGMGRVITDGISDAYIQDVFVLEEFRGQGYGKKIVKYLSDKLLKSDIKWIALVAEPGSKKFYEGLGFKEMLNHTPMKLEL